MHETFGLIDHCTITNTSTAGQGISVGLVGVGALVAYSWHTPQAYGDMNTVVIEDCIFDFTYQGDGALDAYSGAKFVMRHNTFNNTLVGWHGADSGPRAPRLFEIYQNTFNGSKGQPWVFLRSRGGTGVVWGNTMNGGNGGFFILSHYRSDPNSPNTGSQVRPNADGGFDVSHPGQGFPARYPMLDQVGRGSFPASNPGNWPNGYPYTTSQYAALEPMYQWGNNHRGNTSPLCNVGLPSQSTAYIVAGRDYYNNIAKPGYTPLAYPHPLIASGTPIGGGPQMPPPPVVPTNTPPTISTIANQTINKDTFTGPIGFTIGDAQSSAENLMVSGTSSNPTLVPNSNIVFGGSGNNRTVTVTPASGQTGVTTITKSVSDGQSSVSTRFVLTVSAGASAGATWYVDNANSASSDSPSNGSESKPWKTITYALRRISGGDTVLVKNGNYNEGGLYIYGPSGGPGQETTIAAYPGHSPVFRGLGNTGRIAVDGVSYLTIDGFDISNLNHCIQIRNGSHHITVRNCNIHDSGNEVVRVFGNSHDVLLENNIVHDGASLGGVNGEGFYIGTADGDNTYNVTIRGNRIYNTKSEGVQLKPGTHDCIVESNDVSANNTGTVPASSIEVNNTNHGSNPNHIIRNNIVHDSGPNSHGIRAGTGCTVYNNIIYNVTNSKYAIAVDNASGDSYSRRIYNNTLDVGSTRAISLGGGAADIRNNIGPSSPNNMVTSHAYYVNAANRDYRLVAGSEPVNAGANLLSIVPVDIAGNVRPSGSAFDIGAHEYVPIAPSPPTNLGILSAQ